MNIRSFAALLALTPIVHPQGGWAEVGDGGGSDGWPAAVLDAASTLAGATTMPSRLGCATDPAPDTIAFNPRFFIPEGGTLSFGFDWEVELEREGGFKGVRFPRAAHFRLASAGALSGRPASNTESLRGWVDGGVAILLSSPGNPGAVDPTDLDAPVPGAFDWGALSLSFSGEIETDQEFEETEGLVGGSALYTQSRSSGIWLVLPSFLRLQGGFTKIVESDRRDEMEVTDDGHARGDIEAGWHIPLGPSPFTVHLRGRLWKTWGIADELETTMGEGARGSAALSWAPFANLRLLTLDEIYVGYAAGSTPLDPEDRKAGLVGVVLHPNGGGP